MGPDAVEWSTGLVSLALLGPQRYSTGRAQLDKALDRLAAVVEGQDLRKSDFDTSSDYEAALNAHVRRAARLDVLDVLRWSGRLKGVSG